MRIDVSEVQSSRRCSGFRRGTLRTLALFTLGLLAQAAIVIFAPQGNAQVPPPSTPPIVPFTATTVANARGVAGGTWLPQTILKTFEDISATRVAAQMIGDGAYGGVFAPGGEPVIGDDGQTLTITYPSISSSEPVLIQPTMFIGGAGILQQQVQVGITQTVSFTQTLVAAPSTSTIDLFYAQPSLILPGRISATWAVVAPTADISTTLVTGIIEGGLYANIVSDRGPCDLAFSSFTCTIDPLAVGNFGVISVTLETLKAPLMSQFLSLESGVDSLVFTHTTTVQNAGAQPPGPTTVLIDIKPGNRQNVVNTRSNGLLRVAVLSDLSIDVVAEVDQASLRFGRSGSEDSIAFCMSRDENRDGLLDLRCFAHIPSTGLQSGDTEAILMGSTLDGTPILGRDSILAVPRQ